MKFNLRRLAELLCIGVLATGIGRVMGATDVPSAPSGHAPVPAVKIVDLAQWTDQQIKADIAALEHNGQFSLAKRKLGVLEDQVIAFMPRNGLTALRHVDFARRLVSQLSSVANRPERMELLKFLLANHELAATLVFLNTPGNPHIAAVYHRLASMHRQLGAQLVAYPNLTAAICMVLYEPLTMQINENLVHSPNPVKLFKYYVRYRHAMYFGIRHVPARLLLYVVDSCSSIKDMTWALNKYHGDAMVGQLFFTIPYDYNAYLHGSKKKVDIAGYNLPNILKYGGVCADQAFFASEVGKAIGVPTAYDTGMSSVVGHAWVGFLQQIGNQGIWNFNVGRYSEYRGVVGIVQNPVTRKAEPDSFMSLSSQYIGTTQRQRWNATVLTDAAVRLVLLSATGNAFSPPALPAQVRGCRPHPLANTTLNRLELLRRAVDQCDGFEEAWMVVRYLAMKHKLTFAEKETWAGAAMRLCGRRFPDFAMAVVAPMIQSVTNLQQQNDLWNRAYALFATSRFDLAAEVRMAQAHLWQKAGHYNRAGNYLMDVINQYANAGPFIIPALHQAAAILRRQKHNNRITRLYEMTWSRIAAPPRMADPFMHESNWYKVGKLLEARLRDKGQTLLADKVKRELDSGGNAVAGNE